jgi:transcriptional regulator with XRE-family HTH domain
MSTLQKRIREALKKANMRPIDLANAIGVSRATVSLWVNGPTQKIDGENLTRAARVLGVNAYWLATGEKDYSLQEDSGKYATSSVAADEARILQIYRELEAQDKLRCMDIIEALLKRGRKIAHEN